MATLPPALQKIFPFESRYLTVPDGKIHYIDEGTGPVVFLFHGNPTWSFYYRRLIQALSSDFRVIAPDMIGCGLSDRPRGKHFRAEDRIRQMQDFIAALGVEKYSLVMHDWGGSIGTGVIIRNPAAIERIVYLNTTLTETESLPLIIKLSASALTGKFLTRHTKRFLKVTTDWGVARKLPKEVRQGYHYPYRTRRERDAIWDFVADIPFDSSHPTYVQMMHLADELPKLEHVPVKIVWGLKDPCFHREMLTKVARHFPQAEIVELPNASHLVLEDEPEVVCREVKEFLLANIEGGSRAASAPRKQHALVAALERQVDERPSGDAVISPSFIGTMARYAHYNYRALRQMITKYERGLTTLGLSPGDKVLMLVPGGEEFLMLSYAVMARGAIPFYLDPGMGRDNLIRCIGEIDPDVLIGSPKAHLLRMLKRKTFERLKFHIVASEWVYGLGPNLSFLKKFAANPLPQVTTSPIALVAFTSGGTGRPKGVIYTNEMIEEQLRIFRDVFGFEAGKKDLPLLPIFSLFQLASGVCSVFPPMDAGKPLAIDPLKVVQIINDLGIHYSFGSPTLWNKIAEYCTRTRSKLPSIEKIMMAGAPVPRLTMTRLKEVVEHGELFTPYGATEALPVTIVSSEEVFHDPQVRAQSGELGTLVGRAIPGVTMKVIRSVDGPIHSFEDVEELAPCEIGEVIVSGKNISTSYLSRPDGTDSGKIPNGGSIWHRMGDMGYLDQAGNLYFCGRRMHMVVWQSQRYYSVPVERIFNVHPKVRRSALISFGVNNQAAIVIEPFPHYWPESDGIRQEFERELLSLAEADPLTKSIRKIFFHRSFPVDARHNAKIFRDRLSQWATESMKAA